MKLVTVTTQIAVTTHRFNLWFGMLEGCMHPRFDAVPRQARYTRYIRSQIK